MTPAFLDLVDLASERLGGAVVVGERRVLRAEGPPDHGRAPVWREGEYTERGKWMDGWETRRRREAGELRLVHRPARRRGIVRGVDVRHRLLQGQLSRKRARIDVCDLPGARRRPTLLDPAAVARGPAADAADGRRAQPRSRSTGAPAATHLRLRIFPDGGVARLRVYGEVVADWDAAAQAGEVDLAAAEHGGVVVACSDMFFGSRHNLIMPGDATHMGDGWETRRRRGPGHDWTVVRLGAAGTIRRVDVDTRHFKGNAPGACSLDARCVGALPMALTGADSGSELLPRTPLQPHTRAHLRTGDLRRSAT